MRHGVGMLLYPDFQGSGLAASTVFGYATDAWGHPAYEVALVAEQGGLVRSSQGFMIDMSVSSSAVVIGVGSPAHRRHRLPC